MIPTQHQIDVVRRSISEIPSEELHSDTGSKVNPTPVIAAIEKLADQKPRKWKLKIKRNQAGGISEVVAMPE